MYIYVYVHMQGSNIFLQLAAADSKCAYIGCMVNMHAYLCVSCCIYHCVYKYPLGDWDEPLHIKYAINDAPLESIMLSDNTEYSVWSALYHVTYTLDVSYAVTTRVVIYYACICDC